MADLVFVYGTLKQGQGNHRLLTTAEFKGTGQRCGARMLDTGGFPAVIHSNDADEVVHGELYSNFDLRRLDGLEGYREDRPDTSMYLREKVKIETTNGPVWAWMYVWNYNRDLPVIADGVWKG